MIETALQDLWYGFGVALEPHNLMYCFLGVLVGNLVGVLPGMGPVATISILLPLTFGMKPVAATVIGMPKVEHIEQNVTVAKAFKPLPADEMKRMSGDLSAKNKLALDHYFRNHIDA